MEGRIEGRTLRRTAAVCADRRELETRREARREFRPTLDGGESDALLIASILRGDRNASERFVGRYGRLIAAILRRMGLSLCEREDLYQQVFVHLWEHNCRRLSLWQARGQGKFISFLEVVVMHLVYDYNRRLRDRGHYPESLDQLNEVGEYGESYQVAALTPDLDHLVACRQQRAAIDRMMLRLSPRDAQIIWRRHYQEQSYREIADALGIRIEQVGIVLLRAERRLRKHLASACLDLV